MNCLAGSAGMPLPTIRKCTKCKTALPIKYFAPRYDGDVARYCGRSRALTAARPDALCWGGRMDTSVIKRIALYARVSTLNGQNPEMQLRELREYAQRRSWEVVGEYVDLG